MEHLKVRWLDLLNEYGDEKADTVTVSPTCGRKTYSANTVLETVDTTVDTSTDTQLDGYLPLYEATTKELNYWHAFGCNGFLQDLLREYDLDHASPHAFNHFKIGLDVKRHVATFAIDKTHYHVIHFDKYNAAPLSYAEAHRVLERISELRRQRSYRKDFCGYMLEYFHGDDD